MSAASVYTSSNFDSYKVVVQDQLANLQSYSTGSAIGVLFCDSQLDCDKILTELQAQVPFPIIGGTALAFPFANNGKEYSASLMVISKDGLAYGIAVSEVLDPANAQLQMQQVYEKAMENLGEEPKILLPFFPLMPGVTTDTFVRELFAVAKDIPVFGGVVTNDLISTKAEVFADGQCLNKQMALLVLGGNIRPAFAVCNQITKMADYAPVVTKSMGSRVFSVDDQAFCEYMKTLGLTPEERINGVDALMQYGPIPVEMERKGDVCDDVPEVRCISFTNIDDGSVVFSGSVPEGTRVHVGLLYPKDVEESTESCLRKLQDEIQRQSADDYSYSAMFCISCVARYFVLTGRENVERTLLSHWHSQALPSMGFYSMCEIAPTSSSHLDNLCNRSHSASIVMCAI